MTTSIHSRSATITCKGIDVGQTVKLDWDKSTNSAGCKWFIKAVYKDKSVGDAVKFDFCQEDLVIDF